MNITMHISSCCVNKQSVCVIVGRQAVGQFMKDLLRQNQPVPMPVISRENDTREIQRIKQLVERMICPEARDRCKIAEVCREIRRIMRIPGKLLCRRNFFD